MSRELTAEPVPSASPEVPDQKTRATGGWTIAAFLVAGLVVLVTRSMMLSDAMLVDLPADLRADLDDEGLARLAVRVGVVLGVALMLGAQVIYLVLARLLEKHLYSASVGAGRWRVGLYSAVVMVTFAARQVTALILDGSTLGPPPHAVTASVAGGVVVLAIFVRHLRDLPAKRVLAVAGTAVLLAIVASVG